MRERDSSKLGREKMNAGTTLPQNPVAAKQEVAAQQGITPAEPPRYTAMPNEKPASAAPDSTAISPSNTPQLPSGVYDMPGMYLGTELGAFPDPMAFSQAAPYVPAPPPLAPPLPRRLVTAARTAVAPKPKPSAVPVVLGLGALLYFL